ncbi:hypothetical protein PT974_05677 [Cladobotryum mycophilum]|uniref:DNA endonuclease activator Ctp1 C-terminal domain-containing protein n=1 Tax=Cladobotryum mycophilum TaxID=491253 RepID=A0ABR0SJE2_9HYPO
MATWFERGRPAIFEALNDVCEKIDRDLRAELQQRKSLLKDAGTCTVNDDDSGDNLATIDRLEKENAKLQAQLATMTASTPRDAKRRDLLLDAPRYHPPPTPSATETTPTSSNSAKGDNYDFVKLQLRFNALSDNFKKAKEALQRRKDERDKWIQHATWLEKKIKAAEEEHMIHILERGHRNSRANKPSASFTSDDGILDLPPLPPSTQGEPEEEETMDLPPLEASCEEREVVIKHEPSSDTPVVVSERVLKKRRVEGGGGTEVTGIRRIKLEPNDSSPIRTFERYGIHTQESLDLGDIAQKMATPRKRKEVDDPHQGEEQEMPSDTPTPLFVHPDHPQTVSRVNFTKRVPVSSILTPVSGNKRSIRPTDDKDETPSVRIGLSRGIGVLAEDGGVYGKDTSERKQRNLNTPISTVKGRLDCLLNTPALENTPTISRLGQTVDSPQHDLGIPERRELPFERMARQNNKRHSTDANTTPRFKAPDQRTPAPERSPQKGKNPASVLRRKPLSELRLDDFKINPATNDGHDFAFSEVVRDKDDRACLRGCTDLHCCGKQFRALALSQRPNPPLTAAQRQEEQKLLEAYLGDYSYRLAAMSKEERNELWLEAKTEELANKYGKHRHRFSRMQSPPAFGTRISLIHKSWKLKGRKRRNERNRP